MCPFTSCGCGCGCCLEDACLLIWSWSLGHWLLQLLLDDDDEDDGGGLWWWWWLLLGALGGQYLIIQLSKPRSTERVYQHSVPMFVCLSVHTCVTDEIIQYDQLLKFTAKLLLQLMRPSKLVVGGLFVWFLTGFVLWGGIMGVCVVGSRCCRCRWQGRGGYLRVITVVFFLLQLMVHVVQHGIVFIQIIVSTKTAGPHRASAHGSALSIFIVVIGVVSKKDSGVLVVCKEALKTANLGRQSMLRASVEIVIVEAWRWHVNDICIRHHHGTQFSINERSSCFREIAQVGDQARPTKEARKQMTMDPLCPLWVQAAIRLLVLWLEHTHNLTRRVSAKVRSTGALTDAGWLHVVFNRGPYRLDNLFESLFCFRYRVLKILFCCRWIPFHCYHLKHNKNTYPHILLLSLLVFLVGE